MMSDVKQYLNSTDPIEILNQWMEEAQSCSQIKEPHALILSTVDDKTPFSRAVLIKEITNEGLVFYTNISSRKASHIRKNNSCCGHIYWDALYKQISIIGKAVPISAEKTQSYWETRSKESQLSQRISRQSSSVENRESMIQLLEEERKKWEGKSIPCPPHWSGYLLSIDSIEFWIGQDHRLHDRFLFTKKQKTGWKIERLFP